MTAAQNLSTILLTATALCLLPLSFAHAQTEQAAPTMQDVLNSLEQGDDTQAAAPAVTEEPATTAPAAQIQEQAPVQTQQEAPVVTSAPDALPPSEAPPIENINPALAPKIPVTPEAPTAERAETPPAPPKPPAYIAAKFAELQTLDKVTARTGTITIPVGETVAIGPLFVQVKTCQQSAPLEQPESAAFLQVWEATPKDTMAADKTKGISQWVFSGWMFASSPALSAMDHPIYDIWVLNCKKDNKAPAEKSAAKKEASPAKDKESAKKD